MSEVLFFHGFGVGPESLKKTIDAMRNNGFTVSAPAMRSFALYEDDFFEPDEWVAEAEHVVLNFLESNDSSFYLAGHSLGGVICAHLLTGRLRKKLERKVRGCAFLATPAGINHKFLKFWDCAASKKISWPFALQVKMFSFLRQADALFGKIMIPAIIIQGKRDIHIPPSSASMICREMGGNCYCLSTHPNADHFFVNGDGEAETILQQNLIDFLTHCETKRDHPRVC